MMRLRRSGYNNASGGNRINKPLYLESKIARQIDIYLALIVHMSVIRLYLSIRALNVADSYIKRFYFVYFKALFLVLHISLKSVFAYFNILYLRLSMLTCKNFAFLSAAQTHSIRKRLFETNFYSFLNFIKI